MPPTMLIDSLHGVRKKAKTLSIVYGAGIVLACAVGVVMATVFLDWLLDLPALPRLFFMVASIGGIGWAVMKWIARPMLAKLSLSDVAGHIENTFPAFDDRLRSTVNFANVQVPGSNAMKDRVVSEATQMANTLNLNSAVVMKPVVWSMAGGLGAVAIMILLGALVGREYLQPALSRLLRPFDNQAWPKRVMIDQRDYPLPTRVPIGARIDVAMKLAKGDKPSSSAIVYYQYDDGQVQMQNMTRNQNGVFTASIDAKGQKIKTWIKSGDDETKPGVIGVVQRLSINSAILMVTPPKYTKLPAYPIDLVSRPALIPYGSDVALKIDFSKPLDMATEIRIETLKADQSMAKVLWNRAVPMAPVASWNARESVRFKVHATDTDGFKNIALEEFEVSAVLDQSPRVVIEKPNEKLYMTPEGTVKLQARAEDDFDLSSMKLIVDRMRKGDQSTTQPSADHWEVELANWQKIDRTGDFQPFRLNYNWDLATFAKADLKPGDSLEYLVQVKDNFDLDGSTHAAVSSRKMELVIISQKDLENNIIDKLRQVSEEVTQIQAMQRNTKEATKQLEKDTKDKNEFDKGDKEAGNKRMSEQSTVASQTRTLSDRVENLKQTLEDNKSPNQELKDLAKDVKNTLEQAADKPMKEASSKLSDANRQKADPKGSPEQQKKDTEKRNDDLKKAQEQQQKADENLQQALDRMQNIGTLSKAIENIQKLLDKQREVSKETAKIGKENLGKKPEEMNKDSKEALDKNAKEQSQLSKDTQKAADDMKKTAEQMAKSDQAAADAMKQAAQKSQDNAVPQKQQDAAEQAKQNQQSQAQNNQKQAELGLQMMLDTLREAEKRKLEKLVKQLDDAIKAVEALVRQQAGHNIDNLLNEGPDKSKMVTDELMVKAKRNRANMPPMPAIVELPGLQEQTERNTSEVRDTMLGKLPGGAEASANLTRATSRMGYAIVALRDKKLIEAYDPNQTEALAALEAAMAKLQEQKQIAQAKIDQQQKEKLREAFVKLRDEQLKVNERTAKVDQAKQPDGTLKRADELDLRKLPGDQGALADKAKSIGEDLAGISIVYQWANNDIISSMGTVKDDLGKPETGVVTRSEQSRIVEQLNAMIENLSIKPPDPEKFAKKKDDAGGQGDGKPKPKKPKLPSEAELRLLKDLQVAINKATTRLETEQKKQADPNVNNPGDKKPDTIKPKLASLGTRQGELRDLLDKLVKESGGKGLPSKPDEALPEEASIEQIDEQELQKKLLQDNPGQDKAEADLNLVGDRMARSQKRLQDKFDPGTTTQKIQERIVQNMDELIAMARAQQQQQQQQKPGDPQEGPPKPGQGDAQAQNQGEQPGQKPGDKPGQPGQQPGQNGAEKDTATSANENGAQMGNLKETADQWGQISPRLHDAVVESAGERVPEKYRKMVQDYYKSLATKANDRR